MRLSYYCHIPALVCAHDFGATHDDGIENGIRIYPGKPPVIPGISTDSLSESEKIIGYEALEIGMIGQTISS